MTKVKEMRPEPTTGDNYDSYLWPHSKTPEKDRLYQLLRNLDWRYDVTSATFHTPETDTLQGLGRLEYSVDLKWARIQPPSVYDKDLNDWVRPAPLIEFVYDLGSWKVKR